MNRALAFTLLLLTATTLTAQPTPSDFLHMNIGADRVLADYRQVVSYLRALESSSPRIKVETLGKTTEGNEMVMAIVSSEANMKNLPRLKEISARLADPRGLSADDEKKLIDEGKTVVLVTCNIHSTEIASSQMAMEWAHDLVTANDPETKRRLDNVVLLLVPSLNPDGQIMVTDWYRKYLGTRYEGGDMPWLYHHYVGHDNNRDWFMLTQVETRNMSRAVYQEWHPQVFVDEHQMGSSGPRMFIPPFADPMDPDINPLIWREVNIIGSNMAFRLEQQHKAGMIYGYSFDAYWLGGTRNTGWWKNITGLLLETASARVATPVYIDPAELRGGSKGLVEYKPTINFPHPWAGGWWRLRDIMDYERIASDALLETAADRHADFLRDLVTRASEAVASAKPGEAYRIPKQQRDWPTAQQMAQILVEHGVEVQQAPDGDYWIAMAQPYAKFITEMMEPQRYPEVRLQPGAKDILRPYDITTWTLPLQMGVTVEHTTMPDGVTMQRVTKITPETKEVIQRGATYKKPRVAVYKPWSGNAVDEGWTRWLLDTYGFNEKSLSPQQVRAPLPFDAIILPDVNAETIATGRRRSEDGMRYDAELPPEYRGGLGTDGLAALKTFVENGGTLIAFASACDYVIDNFNVPVRNVMKGVKPEDFSAPGSLVRLNVRTDHPVTAGLPSQLAAFIDKGIAFETTAPAADMQRWVLATYPQDPRDILLSGWITGQEKLTGKAAAVAMTYGKGKIVLLGFRPQNRGQTHATFPFVFNSLYWSVSD